MPWYSILIILYLLFCVFWGLPATEVCYPPNRPLGGYYSPEQKIYNVEEGVEYGCNEMFLPLSFNSSEKPYSVCEDSGTWSAVHDTFCDGPPLKPNRIVLMERDEQNDSVMDVTDANKETCHRTAKANRITWLFTLERRSLISAVRIYGVTDESYAVEVIAQKGSMFGEEQQSCGFQKFKMGRKRWALYRCPEGTLGDRVFVKDWTRHSHRQTLCEVEIFSKIESSCEPPGVSIPFGRLVYGRASATLECSSGYRRNTDQHVMCKNSEWQISGYSCIEDRSNEKSVVVILSSVLGASVILMIIMAFGFLLWRRERDLQRTPSVPSISGRISYYSTPREPVLRNEDPDDHEYSTISYSNFFGKANSPRKQPTYENCRG